MRRPEEATLLSVTALAELYGEQVLLRQKFCGLTIPIGAGSLPNAGRISAREGCWNFLFPVSR